MRPSRLARGVAFLMAMLLAGCVVGPDYRLPKESVFAAPAAQTPFAGAQHESAVIQQSLPSRWWRLYQSPDLDRLVTGALAANTDLRIAEANLERSRALVDLAKSAGQPHVGFDAAVERSQFSAEQYLLRGNLPIFSVYDTNLSASYELDLFGRIRRGVEAAKADHEAVEAARDWVRVTVAARVAQAYVEICATGDELAVARSLVDLQQRSADLTRQLMTGGRATSLDLTRSRNLVDQLRSSIPALEARQRNALFRLATLSGKPPAEFESDLTQCVVAPAMEQPIPVGDGAALLRRRPDVRAAERELAAATAEIGVETAALYPRVVLGASIGSTGVTRDFLRRSTNDWALGSLLSWELNQSGPRARIAAASATQKAQLARFDGVVLGALRDVESALNVYTQDLERQNSLTAARDEAASALEDARRLQAEGRIGSLATLDAERTLAGSESAVAALRTQIAQDQVGLFLALGGGWETEGGSPP